MNKEIIEIKKLAKELKDKNYKMFIYLKKIMKKQKSR